MGSDAKRFKALLRRAVEEGVLGTDAAERLAQMAREDERGRGTLALSDVLGWLGGGIAALGVILLLAANWDSIPAWVKIGGLLALLAGCHGLALRLGSGAEPRQRTAEALHFLGAGLFLAGVGLIAQVFHLDTRPPSGVLLWWLAIAPLAVLLRSPPLAVLSVFAGLLWLHMESAFSGSLLETPEGSMLWILPELGLGLGLAGLAPALRTTEPRLASALRACGVLLLSISLYLLGFFRHLVDAGGAARGLSREADAGLGWLLLPSVCLALGAAGLLAGRRRLTDGSHGVLLALLWLLLALGAAIVATEARWLPAGPTLRFDRFGETEAITLRAWSITITAWLLWFALALWCVAFGARRNQRGWVNLGVTAVGLGVITRYGDLMGSLATTGVAFVVSGLVLVATGWAAERWRRNLLDRMEGAA